MKTFADLMRGALADAGPLKMLTASSDTKQSAALVTQADSRAWKVVTSVLVKSKVVDKVSEEIGQPRAGETEEEFVARGLEVFERRLRGALMRGAENLKD